MFSASKVESDSGSAAFVQFLFLFIAQNEWVNAKEWKNE